MTGSLAPSFRKTNRSAYTNFLRAKYETYTGRLNVEAYPYYLCLDPSDRCQLRCPTCPTGIENESRRGPASERHIFRNERVALAPDLFDELLAELGEYLFLINFYNYGEPLLNRQLPSYIARANALDIDTEIHSNLSLPLSDEYIDSLLASGLSRIDVSIDGFSQETYQTHRVGGNLALVKQNLERLVATRERLGLSTRITYNFLVFSFNEHEIPAARQYCADLGIVFNNRDAFVDDPSWLPSYRKHEKPWLVPESARLKEGVELGWSPKLPEPAAADCPPACAWHHGFSVVTSGGAVAPCCAVAKDKDDFGKVVPGQVSFADVWNNDRFKASRAAFAGASTDQLADTICTTCPYPRFLHHLYSIHDAQVFAQFHRVFAGSDPMLEQGFDLLSMARSGLPLHELARRGCPPEHLFVGHENPASTASFVEFIERDATVLFMPPADAGAVASGGNA